MNTVDRSKLKEKYGGEKVFVVDSNLEVLQNLKEGLDGFYNNQKEFLDHLISEIVNNGYFVDRWKAEYNPEYRQIIPYTIVLNDKNLGDLFLDPEEITVFVTERLDKSGEDRLKGMLSIGVGGHINPEDDTKNLLLSASAREIEEETTLVYGEDFLIVSPIGYINDNSNEVSRDHFGIVMTIITQKKASIKEKDTLRGYYMPKDRLGDNLDKLESWSQLIVEEMIGG